jgi:endonuclease/exonuclease/phosphatase family metal-dependent hydrolase
VYRFQPISPKTVRRGLILFGGLALSLVVWLFNVSTPGKMETDVATVPPAETSSITSLRVLSLNMLHGHPDFTYLQPRLDLIAETILRSDADIVLLQEVPWTRKLKSGAKILAQKTGMHYVYLRANGNRWTIFFEEGEAILSKYPLYNLSYTELRPRTSFFEHRVVLHATMSTPLGEVDLFVTHLTNKDEQINQQQAAALREFVQREASHPAIIAGDFNAKENSPQISALAATWTDAFRSSHPLDRGYTCCIDDLRNGPNEILEKRIDYIFIQSYGRDTFIIEDTYLILEAPFPWDDGWLWASDHIGLMTILHHEKTTDD